MDDLVRRLSDRAHPVEVSIRPQRSAAALEQKLRDGFVHLRFTDTRGGTELGVTVDQEHSDLAAADFRNQAGRLTIVGTLTLNDERVKCTATIDLASMGGEGRLEPIAAT